MNCFVCTGNKGKLAEFVECLGRTPENKIFGLRDFAQIGASLYLEPEEPYDIFLANGFVKLNAAVNYTNANKKLLVENGIFPNRILVDDSGLCVSEMQDKPGVHSAYYGGLPRDDSRNRIVLRKALGDLDGAEVRKEAYFICFLFELNVCEQTGEFSETKISVSHLAEQEKLLLSQVKQMKAQKLGFESIEMRQHNLRIHVGFCFGEVSNKEQQLLPDAGHGYDAMFYPAVQPQLSFASIDMATKNTWSHRAQALKSLAAK